MRVDMVPHALQLSSSTRIQPDYAISDLVDTMFLDFRRPTR